MVERQLRCDLLRLILVAGWFVPFWRDTTRLLFSLSLSRAREALDSARGERESERTGPLARLSFPALSFSFFFTSWVSINAT